LLTSSSGSKCKFSHDLNVGRKVEKVNLYEDQREEKKKDLMDTWDEEKLRNVVTQNAKGQRTTTDVSGYIPSAPYQARADRGRLFANSLFKLSRTRNMDGCKCDRFPREMSPDDCSWECVSRLNPIPVAEH
jgi:hypothetical protein